MGAGAILRGLTQAGTRARLGHVKGRQDAEAQRQAQLAQEAQAQKELEAQLRQEALLKFQLEAPKRQREQFDYEQDVQQKNRIAEIQERARQERMRPRGGGSDPYGGRTREQWLADLAAESKAKGGAQPVNYSEGERKNAAMLQVASDVAPILDRVTAPSRPEAWKASIGLNEALSNERQIAEQAAMQFSDAYLRMISGATVTDAEIKNKAREIMPGPGDSKELLARKKRARQVMLQAMRAAAGRAAPPQAAPADDISDADLYEQLRDEGLSHEEAVAQVEARKQ